MRGSRALTAVTGGSGIASRVSARRKVLRMTFELWLDVAASLAAVGAGLMTLSAGVGLLRFRDPLSRLHAATKPQIFGLLLMILALALAQRSLVTLVALVPVFVLQSLTAPVSAHMAARAAYRAGHIDSAHLALDELEPVIKQANTRPQDAQQHKLSAEETVTLKGGALPEN